MKYLLLLVAVALSSAGATSAPLPASVQARVPRGVVSLNMFPVSPGPGAPRFLVHAWTAPRFWPDFDARSNAPKTPLTAGDVVGDKTAPSPFVLDIFSDTKAPTYLTSIAYLSTRPPSTVEARFLNGQTKRGAVFIVTDGFGKLTSRTFFVFPNGLMGDYQSWNQTRSWSGGTSSSTSLRYAPSGALEIVNFFRSSAPNDTGQREFLRWNGHEFAPLNRSNSATGTPS